MHSALHYRGEVYAPAHGATYAYVEIASQSPRFNVAPDRGH
jgi:hypothetical protein